MGTPCTYVMIADGETGGRISVVGARGGVLCRVRKVRRPLERRAWEIVGDTRYRAQHIAQGNNVSHFICLSTRSPAFDLAVACGIAWEPVPAHTLDELSVCNGFQGVIELAIGIERVGSGHRRLDDRIACLGILPDEIPGVLDDEL